MALSKKEKLRRCVGCRSNRYNQPKGWREGPNDAPVSGEGCWNLRTAKSAIKLVYYSPGDYQPTVRDKTLTCWHNEMGFGKILR